jgi:hypothetical protein
MQVDYYSEAKKLANLLKKEGINDSAVNILSSLEEGVTSTEVLMMIRWHIGNYLSSKCGSDEVNILANDLYQKLDKVLG